MLHSKLAFGIFNNTENVHEIVLHKQKVYFVLSNENWMCIIENFEKIFNKKIFTLISMKSDCG